VICDGWRERGKEFFHLITGFDDLSPDYISEGFLMEWRMEHLGLAAKDTTGLARWYRELLGFRQVAVTDETPPAYFLEEPGGMIFEIVPARGETAAYARQDPGWRHVAMVVQDFDKVYNALVEKGVAIEPAFTNGPNRVAFFRDPEGNLLHLIQRGEPLGR